MILIQQDQNVATSPGSLVLAESLGSVDERIEAPGRYGWIGGPPEDFAGREWSDIKPGEPALERWRCVYIDATKLELDEDVTKFAVGLVEADGAVVVHARTGGFNAVVSAVLDGSGGAVTLEHFRTGQDAAEQQVDAVFAIGLRVLQQRRSRSPKQSTSELSVTP